MKEPSDQVYVVLQNHGPDLDGWGIAAWAIPGFVELQPVVYSGDNPKTIKALEDLAHALAKATKKPTILAKYTTREVIATFN